MFELPLDPSILFRPSVARYRKRPNKNIDLIM